VYLDRTPPSQIVAQINRMLHLFAALFVLSYAQDCNDLGYPKQYVVYKLGPGEVITFDGKKEEPAWNVEWTDEFQDIEGPSKPMPYYKTRAKMRWDDKYLYIAAHLEEPQAWANLTINNSIIFHDSDFEIFIDPNGCNRYYKELEFNARNLNWNLLLVRAYLNGGPPVCNFTQPGMCVLSAPEFGVPWWDISPDLPSGVYVEGKLNDPKIGTSFWSIEMGIPIADYLKYEPVPDHPRHGSLWRLDFSRVEWNITVYEYPNGTQVYWKVPNLPEHNWVWQPQYAINMHLPERWGYIQFAEGPINGTAVARDPEWPVRDALMAVYNAETIYLAKTDNYTEDLGALVSEAGLPIYVATGLCASVPIVKVNGRQFTATVTKDHLVGHVMDDRFLWFDNSPKN